MKSGGVSLIRSRRIPQSFRFLVTLAASFDLNSCWLLASTHTHFFPFFLLLIFLFFLPLIMNYHSDHDLLCCDSWYVHCAYWKLYAIHFFRRLYTHSYFSVIKHFLYLWCCVMLVRTRLLQSLLLLFLFIVYQQANLSLWNRIPSIWYYRYNKA